MVHTPDGDEEFSGRHVADLVQARLDATRSWEVLARYEEVFSSLDGIFPAEALNLVHAAGRLELGQLCAEARLRYSTVAPPRLPYGHILDAEWYFTDSSRERICALILASGARQVLLLGCPTLVDPLLAAGLTVTLVDASTHGVEQFVTDGTHERLTIESRYIGPAGTSADPASPLADIVVMDPPWYLPAYAAFLNHAITRVHDRGQIIYPLFKRLTRPSAEAERTLLQGIAAKIGTCSVLKGALQYLTPRFEIESLRANRLPGLYGWRTADLVTLEHPSCPSGAWQILADLASGMAAEPAWDEYRIGLDLEKIVKVRVGPGHGCWPQLVAPASPRGYQLSTVSMRQLRQHEADIWTWKNRTAVSCEPALVGKALAVLGQLPVSIERAFGGLDALPPGDFEELRELLYGKAIRDT